MNEKERRKKSKFLSLILRHQPEKIGITLDASGWVDVTELLTALNEYGENFSLSTLKEVVQTNDKQRFLLNDDETKIRANQGHSVNIELGYQPAIPPETLFHGTPQQTVEIISREGLKKMNRHHVHLHVDVTTSISVGQRRGKPVLLKIEAMAMHNDGYKFFRTPNNVWLTDHVPVKYLEIADVNP